MMKTLEQNAFSFAPKSSRSRFYVRESACKMADYPAAMRPDAEADRVGVANVADATLLALLVTGNAKINRVDLAAGLLLHFGSLAGLTRSSVAELASVDGMTDMESSVSTHWNTVYGGAKYINERRDASAATEAVLLRWAEERMAAGETFGCHSAGNMVMQLVSDTSLPAGAVVTGAEQKPADECNGINRPSTCYRIAFTVPDPVPAWHETAAACDTGERGAAVTVTENAAKDGVEIRHAGKPSDAQRADMKAHGFRCTRRPPWVWYARRNARTLGYAYGLAGKPVPEHQEADPMGLDAAYEDACAAACGL